MSLRSILILVGLVIGLLTGAIGIGTTLGQIIAEIARPVGTLWLNALTMTVVPLVFSLLVSGIAATGTQARGSRIGRRALFCIACFLVGACLLSVVVTTALLRVWPVPASAAALSTVGDAPPQIASTADWIIGFVPANPIKAAAEMAMTPLVIFAALFGLAVTRIGTDLQESLLTFFRALVQTMLVIVEWVLWTAPVGVCALAINVGAKTGAGAAGALGHYVIVISATCVATAVACYLVAPLCARISIVRFWRALLPAQVVALSTQSSLASLPAMVEGAGALGVATEDAAIVLPLAVSIFRAASAAANIAVAIYLGHLLHIPLSIGMLLLGAVVAAAVSLAAVGLPAQVSFFATIGPVCLAMGVPIGILPLLMAVETFPDIFRTVGNVTADLTLVRIVGSSSRAS